MAIILLLLLSSCKEEKVLIGVLISGEGRLQKVEGFKDGLKSLGVKDVELVVYNGGNSLAGIEEKAIEMVEREGDFRLIAAGGSLEAHYLKKAKENLKVPVVILGGTAIKTWGFVDDMYRPVKGITGVDNLNTELMEKRIELFKRLFPNINKALVFCTHRFEASKIATRLTIKAGERYGLKIVPLIVNNVHDLEYVISHMKEDGFEAIIITPCFYTENFLTSYILHYARFYQVPVLCLSPEHTAKGCTVAYGSSNYDQGYQASYIAYQILRGVKVEDIPFEQVHNVKLSINESSLRELGYYPDNKLYTIADQIVK
ncbi:MAG: ABC transporter substrate binding protein [Aquificaceae bacterium]|uniref:ABC transporter substrate binding protein n=1 Tax=Hydrogenobacter sp. Uz 6-8 TaxID=3384828 RepID=UPI0030A74D62